MAPIAVWALAHLVARPRNSGKRPVVIGHRGAAAVAPENTLAAVRAGRESGASHLEVDVQRSRDGVLVLLHDRSVDRTSNGRGEIDQFTLEQLRQLDAGSWFAPPFDGEAIPTLEQTLQLLDGWQGTLVVEAKHPEAHPNLARDLATAVKRRPDLSYTFVSFDHGWLRRFSAVMPSASLGELWLYPMRLPSGERVERVGVFWLAPLLDPTLVRRAHARGLELWVWTVDPPWLARLMAWLGVDGITSNHPARTLNALGR